LKNGVYGNLPAAHISEAIYRKRFAFSQLMELFQGQSSKPEVISELFWASLHGIAELTRTKRFPRIRQKERLRALVELFSFPRNETAQVMEA